MPTVPVVTPAIILSTLRYGETSKIARIATRDLGVQSAIARGALRPKSRFGAALHLLSEGQAYLILARHGDLHTLTAFDIQVVRVALGERLDRYATASVLGEIMLRFAPPAPHPESYDVLRGALDVIAAAPSSVVDLLGLRLLWQLVCSLGFAPTLDACVRDGRAVPVDRPAGFSTGEGGVLCATCGAMHSGTKLQPSDRSDLMALIDSGTELPLLDDSHLAAHRRLLSRYIRYHLAEGADLPALAFWEQQPWVTP